MITVKLAGDVSEPIAAAAVGEVLGLPQGTTTISAAGAPRARRERRHSRWAAHVGGARAAAPSRSAHPRARRPTIAEAGALEFVRYSCPVQVLTRRVTADIDTQAGTMRTGDKLMLLLGAANRDPRRCGHPDVLWLDRPAVAPFGFGAGPHRCLGVHVGRLIVGEFIARFVTRYARIHVADRELRLRESVLAHRLEALHLHVSAR
jgi:cytochrome P450